MGSAKTIESRTAAERKARLHVREVLGEWFPSHADEQLDGIAELAWASTDADLVPDRRAIAALAAARRRVMGTAPPRPPAPLPPRPAPVKPEAHAPRRTGRPETATEANARARVRETLGDWFAGVPAGELDRIAASAWASTDEGLGADRRAIAALAAARADGLAAANSTGLQEPEVHPPPPAEAAARACALAAATPARARSRRPGASAFVAVAIVALIAVVGAGLMLLGGRPGQPTLTRIRPASAPREFVSVTQTTATKARAERRVAALRHERAAAARRAAAKRRAAAQRRRLAPARSVPAPAPTPRPVTPAPAYRAPAPAPSSGGGGGGSGSWSGEFGP